MAQQRPFPGAVDNEGHVTFTLYAPEKQSVHLIGDFNDWDPQADPLHLVDEGLWTTARDLPRGTFAYQFLIDGRQVICDPYARYLEQAPGDRPRKAMVKPREDAYQWHHDTWSRPQFRDLLIHEIHIADFTPQRTFREATSRLDYLRDLGMNAIELMPVFGVHENRGWGYTPSFLFAPNEDYGSPNELRWLIDEAHCRGIAVILDMVLAHTGHEHPFNQMYPYDQSPWYGSGSYEGNEFGFPQLDYSKHATRFFAQDVLAHWLEDYHVDGFRFDYIKGLGHTADGHGIPTLSQLARAVRPDAYLIGEHVPEDPQGMISAGMDGAWHSRFNNAMRALLCECPGIGYDWNDFETALTVLDAANEGYAERPTCMVNFIESHDEERTILQVMKAGFDRQTATRKSALGASILFTAVGEPMIYHGQPLGQDTPKNMDHNFIQWERMETPEGRGLHDHYKRLAWLRRQRDSLRTDHLAIDGVWPEQQCIVYHRWNDAGEQTVIAANFSGSDQKITIPLPEAGTWTEFFSDRRLEAGKTLEIDLDHYAAQIFIRQ